MKIQLEKLVSWYFSRESLPYWCILIIDTVIVFVSGFLSYLIINNKNELIDNLHSVAITMPTQLRSDRMSIVMATEFRLSISSLLLVMIK